MAQEPFDFRSWIREQPQRGFVADLSDDDHFVLQTDFATAQINFYAMDPDPEVVEFNIEEKKSGEVRFFLHFHAVERDHAVQLYSEMTQTLVQLRNQESTEVLLCCTAGMTTSFFAQRLNQVAEAMGIDYTFSAVSVNEVYENGQNKAAVLIAPQISYEADRVRMAMGNVPVLAIPTAIFAAYDAGGCVEWLREELRQRSQTAEERAIEQATQGFNSDKRIVVVAVHAATDEVNLHYRLVDHGNVEQERKVIKRWLTLEDITDVIDTQVCICKGGGMVDAIGIALPGALHNGRLDLKTRNVKLTDGTDDFVLADYLRERYAAPVVLCNNVNAAALGWYAGQDEYESVTFYSQAVGWAVGGQGHVIGGKLVEGAHGNAGEIKYVVDRFSYSHPLHYNPYDPADVIEMVGQMIAMDCATLDPEVVVLRCDLLSNMDEVATELEKYVPRELQPKLVKVRDYNEYILRGVLISCIQQLF